MPIKLEEHNGSLSRTATPEPDFANLSSHGVLGLGSSVLAAPLNLLNLVTMKGISVLRPYAPQFVPIFVCLFLVPVAVCLSLVAGWIVWKNLAVGWEVPLYLQYGERVTPYAHVSLPPLKLSQPYDISVHMRLPVSESNMSLGNFMTSLTLSTSSNRTLAIVSRPALAVPPKRSWFMTKPNVVDIEISLLRSFVSSTTNTLAYVEIGRRDGWKSVGDGQVREVNVLSASLRGTAIPRGIRGIAMRFPLFAASISSCTFLIILSLIIGSCVLPIMLPVPIDRSSNAAEAETRQKFEHDEPPSRSQTRSNSNILRQRRSKSNRHTSSHSRISVRPEAEETSEVVIPSATHVTEEVPDVTAHVVGPASGAGPGEQLRRRSSQRFEGPKEAE